jgi:hypothetical protein
LTERKEKKNLIPYKLKVIWGGLQGSYFFPWFFYRFYVLCRSRCFLCYRAFFQREIFRKLFEIYFYLTIHLFNSVNKKVFSLCKLWTIKMEIWPLVVCDLFLKEILMYFCFKRKVGFSLVSWSELFEGKLQVCWRTLTFEIK